MGAGLALLAYLAWRFAVGKALAQHDEATAQRPPAIPPKGPTTPEGTPTWAQQAEAAAG